jgi:hypothetical protein
VRRLLAGRGREPGRTQTHQALIHGAEALDENTQVFGADWTRGIKVDMKLDNTYVFVAGEKETSRRIEILMGGDAYISRHTRGLTGLPTVFSLNQNAPNPFNPVTVIRYAIPRVPGAKLLPARLAIYNTKGQLVKVLVSRKQNCGYYSAVWNSRSDNGRMVASGLYFYRLQVGEKFVKTMKMVVLK